MLSVASYNVLADAYIRPQYYPGVDPVMLEPAGRRARLLERVAALDSSVVALQEVESPAFAAVAARLSPLGYRAVHAPKSGKRPDGCSSFFRESDVALQAAETLSYSDRSGHLALIVMLRCDSRIVGVASTHLKWDPPGTPPAAQRGLGQISELIAWTRTAPQCAAWVICGDFNVTADSAVAGKLRDEGFSDAYQRQPRAFTCNSNGLAKRIDFLFHTSALVARPRAVAPIDDNTPLPSHDEPSDHLPIAADFAWA